MNFPLATEIANAVAKTLNLADKGIVVSVMDEETFYVWTVDDHNIVKHKFPVADNYSVDLLVAQVEKIVWSENVTTRKKFVY